MIQKITKIFCDNCGKRIYDWPDNLSYNQIITECNKRGIAIIVPRINKRIPFIFCDEKCQEEYEDKHWKPLETKVGKKS